MLGIIKGIVVVVVAKAMANIVMEKDVNLTMIRIWLSIKWDYHLYTLSWYLRAVRERREMVFFLNLKFEPPLKLKFRQFGYKREVRPTLCILKGQILSTKFTKMCKAWNLIAFISCQVLERVKLINIVTNLWTSDYHLHTLGRYLRAVRERQETVFFY